MISFKVGDKAVYPGHGVGEVTGIESREISGMRQTFYILRIMDNGMKIMIPTNNVSQVGLREIMTKEQAEEVFAILRERPEPLECQTWNRRQREYMEKIRSGSIQDIAEVLRELYLLKGCKELSFGERKILDIVKNLLIKELSLAREKGEGEIEGEIDVIFEDTIAKESSDES